MGRQSQQYIPSACNHLAGIVEFCPIDKKLTKRSFGQNRGALHVLSFVILSAAKNPYPRLHWPAVETLRRKECSSG